MNEMFESVAGRLRAAYTEGQLPPLREALAADDVAGAYAIQDCNTAHWCAQGRRIAGRKIGLTAKSVRQQLGVSQPDSGVLFADMALADGDVLEMQRLLQGRVEAEIALVLAADLEDPDCSLLDVARATEFVVAALEICDSRIQDWRITIADTIADNASAGCFVLGAQPRKLHNLDLRLCGMALEVNGQIESTGVGADCFSHPLKSALWLARMEAARGRPLRRGDVILTGALGPMIRMTPNSHVRAEIGGLGTVNVLVGPNQERRS
jgi:2-keto-4-pentenoate hydratase